jgi:hypothetical protein
MTANLHGHQKAFPLDIRKAEVNAARITLRVTVSEDVIHLRCDAIDESL